MSEPDDEADERWAQALVDQMGMERTLKALARLLTTEAQALAHGGGDAVVAALVFSAAASLEDAAFDYYASTK